MSSEATNAQPEHSRAYIHLPKLYQRSTHAPGTVPKIVNKTSKPPKSLMGSDTKNVNE